MFLWATMWIAIHIMSDEPMKTIQITIDEALLDEVDSLTATLQTTRSAFIRSALQLALRQHAVRQQEARHAEGYARFLVQPGEFDGWEAEQSWGER